MKLYEISAIVQYNVVIYADSEEAALTHVADWETCWPTSAEFGGVHDVEVTDVRDGSAEDAHETAKTKEPTA